MRFRICVCIRAPVHIIAHVRGRVPGHVSFRGLVQAVRSMSVYVPESVSESIVVSVTVSVAMPVFVAVSLALSVCDSVQCPGV